MPQKQRWGRDLIIIAALALTTVVVWIGLSIYRSLKTSTIPKIIEEQLKPLNPEFDTQVINALHLRKQINQSELNRLPPRALSLVVGETEKTKTSTASAKPKSTPESTVSGQINP